jgi:hypothetical protein
MENMMEQEPADPPVVGEWYADPQGALFEVVAIDQDDGTVEVQYFDGTVEELEADSWEEMRPKPTDPPEDWSGSMDVEREDYGVERDDGDRGMWANPLDNFDR